MYQKNSHCSYCGHPFRPDQLWPRTCDHCGNMSFMNPVPVVCVLLPVGSGLVLVRRGIEPQKGHLAVPGGYIQWRETWQVAGAREVLEETGLVIAPDEIREFRVHSTPEGSLLIFGLAKRRTAAELPPFQPVEEVSERLVVTAPPQALAFPLHTQVVKEFFNQQAQSQA